MHIKCLSIFFICLHPLLLTAATWNLNANGNWNVDGNWMAPAMFPDGVGDVANFFNVITQTRTVTLGQNITIGTIDLQDNNRYNISGGNSLSFNGGGTAGLSISNGNGTHRILCPVILNDSLTVDHMSNAIVRIIGDMSGSGGIIKTGTGQLRLQGNGSYLGTTVINEGTLFYNNDGCIPTTSSVTVGSASNGLLRINQDISVGNALDVTINANGTLRQNNGDTVRLVSLAGSGGVLKSTGGGSQNFIDIIGSTNTTFSGMISGGASNASSNPAVGNRILKSGTSTLTLTGGNTYTCRTFIQSGAINVQNSMALGSAGVNNATYIRSGGTLEIENNINLIETFNLNGTGNGGAGAIHNVSGDNTLSAVITVGWSGGAETAAAATVQVDNGTTLTMNGLVQGSTNLTLIGDGTLRFSGLMANTHTGTTIVNSGTLDLNKTGVNAIAGNVQVNGGIMLLSQANQIVDTANVTLSGGTFDLGSNNETINRLVFESGTLTQGVGSTLTLTDGLTMRDTSISGNIVLTTGGTVVFDAANNGTAMISGNINQSGATILYNIDDGAASSDMTISGVISNGGLTKTGAGTLELTGLNTYTGNTTATAGTLNLNAAGNAIAGDIEVNGGTLLLSQADQVANTSDVTLDSGDFNLNGNNETINSLTFNGGTLTQGGGSAHFGQWSHDAQHDNFRGYCRNKWDGCL